MGELISFNSFWVPPRGKNALISKQKKRLSKMQAFTQCEGLFFPSFLSLSLVALFPKVDLCPGDRLEATV